MAHLEVELVKGGPSAPRVQDLRARVEDEVELLMKNQSPVRAKAEAILAVRNKEFWATVTVPQLEALRRELRGIMKFQHQVYTAPVAPRVFDVAEGVVSTSEYIPRLEGLELVEYKRRVEGVIREHFATNPVLQTIRAGQPVQDDQLEELVRLILQVDDKANVKYLAGHRPETRRSLLTVFRSVVGLDPAAVA